MPLHDVVPFFVGICHATSYNMQGGNAFINFSNIRPDANALGIRISVVLSILYGIGVFDE